MTAADALLAGLRIKAGTLFRHDLITTQWHSAGLSGERHELHLTFHDPAAAANLLVGLTDHDFNAGNSFVADIVAGPLVADGDVVRVSLEALTLAA